MRNSTYTIITTYTDNYNGNIELLCSNQLLFVSFSIHICLTLLHTEPGVADKFLVDLRTNVKQLMKNASPATGSHVSNIVSLVM